MTELLEREAEVELCRSVYAGAHEAGIPRELWPLVYEDAHVEVRAEPELLAKAAVSRAQAELLLAKAAKDHLDRHGANEVKVARALHAVMRRMQRDVKRRIIDRQTLEPNVLIPHGRWWRAARQAVIGVMRRAARDAGRQVLRDYNTSRRLRKDLRWGSNEDVLIELPREAGEAMDAMMAETFSQDYWMAWEASTRAMVDNVVRGGIRAHLSTMQIADIMDDAWAFDFKRAMLVGRTETTTAMNAGHYVVDDELIRDPRSAVTGRGWLAILDRDTRDDHRVANGQQVVLLPSGAWEVRDRAGQVLGHGQMFIVGGERCRFPGDPTLSAGQRIKCRCVTISLFEGQSAPVEQLQEA